MNLILGYFLLLSVAFGLSAGLYIGLKAIKLI